MIFIVEEGSQVCLWGSVRMWEPRGIRMCMHSKVNLMLSSFCLVRPAGTFCSMPAALASERGLEWDTEIWAGVREGIYQHYLVFYSVLAVL